MNCPDNGTRTGEYALYRDFLFRGSILSGRNSWETMAEQFDIPLPEIAVEEFQRSWTCFELVAGAKEWPVAKQKVILPTLLRGKLVDIYMGLDDTTRDDLKLLKKALMKDAGLVRDPLSAGQLFMTRHQLSGEKVNDFASELKKLFTESYPSEAMTSAMLLQHFMTGLSPPICRQLLLKGQPTTLEDAIKSATDAEYALTFDSMQERVEDVNVIHQKPPSQQNTQVLEALLGQMTKRLEALETKIESSKASQQLRYQQPRPHRPPRQRYCWICGDPGHLQRDCPLNESRPARQVGGWPRP